MTNSDDILNTAYKILTDFLKKNSLRKTPERFAILETVISFEGHFSFEQLSEKMCTSKYPVSKATLYNNMSLLADAGIIVKHHIANNAVQYEFVYKTKMHSHLICTSCGKMTEIRNKDLIIDLESSTHSDFNPSHYSLYIYGKCSTCVAKQNA